MTCETIVASITCYQAHQHYSVVRGHILLLRVHDSFSTTENNEDDDDDEE